MTKKTLSSFFLISSFVSVLILFLIIAGCESSRVGPELPRPNPPAPAPTPLVLKGFVKDASSKAAIDAATVKISKADGTVLTTVFSNASGQFSYDVSNVTETSVLVSASKTGYGFNSQVAEINKTLNNASVDDVLLAKLQTTSTNVTPATGGQANTTNTQSLASQPLNVTVPPNAVPQNVTVTIAAIPAAQVPPPPAATNTTVVSAGNFQPSGTVFQQPVTIKFPLPVRKNPGTTYQIQQINETTGAYTNSGFTATVDATGTIATGQVTHFTIYTLTDAKSTLNLPDATPTATGASFTLEVLATQTTDSENASRTVSLTISGGSGDVNLDWLTDEIKKALNNLNTGTFSRLYELSFNITSPENQGGKPSWVQNGVIVGPRPGESGDAIKRAVYNKFSKTRNGTVTGNTSAGTPFTRNVTLIEETWVLDTAKSGWFWRKHGQGTIIEGPF